MAEYIEREALLADIDSSIVFSAREPNAEMGGANKIIDRIKNAPVADEVSRWCGGSGKTWNLPRGRVIMPPALPVERE